MRWTATAAARWPSGAALDTWWRSQTRELEVALDGSDPQLPCVAGTPGSAGARYVPLTPHLTRGTATLDLSGPDRRLRGRYQETGGGRRYVECDVNSLDVPFALTARSTLQHLDGEVAASVDHTRLLRGRLDLDWLRIELSADLIGGQLRVALGAHGKGLWRPMVAGLLAAATPVINREFHRSVAEVARAITDLETDPLGTSAQDLAQERRRAALLIVRDRLQRVLESVQALPWWRRTTRAHRRAMEALPAIPGGWPCEPPLYEPSWWQIESDLLTQLLAMPRRRRRAGVETVVQRYADHCDEVLVRARQQTPPSTLQADFSMLTDANLDLSWLASPVTTLRRLGTSPETLARDLSDDSAT